MARYKKVTWVEEMTHKQLREAFKDWQEAKEAIDEPPKLWFRDWKQMERNIAIHLGDFKLKKVKLKRVM